MKYINKLKPAVAVLAFSPIAAFAQTTADDATAASARDSLLGQVSTWGAVSVAVVAAVAAFGIALRMLKSSR